MTFEIKGVNNAIGLDTVESLTVEFTFADGSKETINVGVQQLGQLTQFSVSNFLTQMGNAMQEEIDKVIASTQAANALIGLTSQDPVTGV